MGSLGRLIRADRDDELFSYLYLGNYLVFELVVPLWVSRQEARASWFAVVLLGGLWQRFPGPQFAVAVDACRDCMTL